MRWNVNNSTTSSIKYIFSYCSKMTALHHTVKNCHNTLTVLTLMEDPSSTCTVKNCHNTLTVLTLMEDPSSTYTVKNCHNTLTVLTLIEGPSSTCTNGSVVCDPCEHHTRQLRPSCTACTEYGDICDHKQKKMNELMK